MIAMLATCNQLLLLWSLFTMSFLGRWHLQTRKVWIQNMILINRYRQFPLHETLTFSTVSFVPFHPPHNNLPPPPSSGPTFTLKTFFGANELCPALQNASSGLIHTHIICPTVAVIKIILIFSSSVSSFTSILMTQRSLLSWRGLFSGFARPL